MGALDTTKAEGLNSSDIGFAWGRRMRVSIHKTWATSRRSGYTSRCSRRIRSQCHDVKIQRHDMPGSL